MSSTRDYIPRSDADFNTWLTTFMSAIDTRGTALGVIAGEVEALQTARNAWITALAEHNEAQVVATTATQIKNQARENLEDLARATVRRLQTHPNIQDSDRLAFGINTRSTARTQAPAPSTRPVAQVDTGQRLRHTITFSDETTPNSRAKPDGIRGCEIWVKVGEAPPASPSELTFLALDTASPYVTDYDGTDAGKTAHYMLRWANTRGEQGPWSQTVSATITA
jgi:hypothetical protein